MRISVILITLYLLGSCGDANPEMVAVWSAESTQEADIRNEIAEELADNLIVDTIDNVFEIYNELETAYSMEELTQLSHESDSVESRLEIEIALFFEHLSSNNFGLIRPILHPNGVYYYTTGRIPPEQFNLQGLKEHSGLLEGAYSYGLPDEYEESDKVVDGLFWLNSLRNNYTLKSSKWHDAYSALGYGFTGNYSSDHINLEYELEYGEPNLYHIAYIPHNSDEIDERDMLMLEFFQNDNRDWKLYAIGNLEWTP